MKIILYMAITANGFIARENNNTDFVSEIEWQSFKDMIGRIGNIIIGRKTYEIMKNKREFIGLDKIRVVVVTSDNQFKADREHLVAKSPKEAVFLLEKQGFQEVLIAGGGTLNSSFAKENLIDEIYLDIEPIIFGKGIQLFRENDFEIKLELLEIKKLSPNEIQLHYKIRK